MDDSLKKANEKAAATYDAAADHFDDEPLGFWDLIGTRTVAKLNLPSGAKVLDVGCGTGASALPAAQAVGKSRASRRGPARGSGRLVGGDLERALRPGRGALPRPALRRPLAVARACCGAAASVSLAEAACCDGDWWGSCCCHR